MFYDGACKTTPKILCGGVEAKDNHLLE